MLNSLFAHEIRHAIDNYNHPELFADGVMETEKAKLFKSLEKSGKAAKAYKAVVKSKDYKDFVNRRIGELKKQHPEYGTKSICAKEAASRRERQTHRSHRANAGPR